ncbi:CDP-glycerol glycerophosphotransferase family protein [Fructilactobacillus sp. Tb1]|uniref:CDP-glycerol glycerophosphotransferase family protein n=1 Tax=Fructilactobacillus sp. Tb1 TaxID=3422304 RepID=UPI003D28AAA4
MSYNNNLHMIKQTAAMLPANQKLVVLYNPRVMAAAYDLQAFGITAIPMKRGFAFAFRMIPGIMTARIIFVDNYYAFIAGLTRPKNKMKIVQLWHADGSIKCFGIDTPKFKQYSWLKKKRHQTVYNNFDEFVVASPAMAEVFENSFKQPYKKMQFLGTPRSDRLFSEKWINVVRKRVYAAAPELKDKRVILYAPTYRPSDEINPPEGTIKALAADKNAVVAVKLYQDVDRNKLKLDQFNLDNVKIYDEFTTTDLMSIADTFVTDYSSYAFDYSLMPQAHSMIFFMYDYKEYAKNPGIQVGYEKWLPTKPIHTVTELKEAVLKNEKSDFTEFNIMWNTYNDGKAYQRVLNKYVVQQPKEKTND